MNCRLKPRNQKVEIRNGSWVHSSHLQLLLRSACVLFFAVGAPLKEGLTGSRKRKKKIMKEISCRSKGIECLWFLLLFGEHSIPVQPQHSFLYPLRAAEPSFKRIHLTAAKTILIKKMRPLTGQWILVRV